MNHQRRTCLICGLTGIKTLAFPQGISERDKERFEIWLEFCKKFNPPKERLEMKHKRLCLLHFEDKYLRHPCRKFKMKESIPTLPAGNKENQVAVNSSKDEKEGQPNQAPTCHNLVLGHHSLKEPEASTSPLNKTKLPRKRVSVNVLPLKKKDVTKLTRNSLTKIVENSPTVKISLKNRLLKALKCKNLPFKQHVQGKCTLKRKHLQSRKPRQSTCPVHCSTRRCKKQKVCNVSSGLHIKIGGSCLRDSQVDNSFEEAENMFTVSSIITNINDKDQLERLCQLVLESIFKLKNVNVNGTKSKIEIFLCQNSEVVSDAEVLSYETGKVAPFTPDLLSDAKNNNDHYSSGISHSYGRSSRYLDNGSQFVRLQNMQGENGSTVSDVTLNKSQSENYSEWSSSVTNSNNCQKQETKKLFKVDLNFYHDHSYLSLDSQVLFQKPPYLVNLVNIDKYKSSKKKTRVIKRIPSETTEKVQKKLIKLSKQVTRLREILKSKNKNIEKIRVKLKYLRNKLCKEQGLKHIRYPKTKWNADSVNLLHTEEETIDISRKDKEINNKKGKKKNCKGKKRTTLTPDFNPLECHSLETSIVEFGDKCEFFYDAFLEEGIEKG